MLSLRERLARAITFYFFFTVPGLLSMRVMGGLLWWYAPIPSAVVVVTALVHAALENQGQDRVDPGAEP